MQKNIGSCTGRNGISMVKELIIESWDHSTKVNISGLSTRGHYINGGFTGLDIAEVEGVFQAFLRKRGYSVERLQPQLSEAGD